MQCLVINQKTREGCGCFWGLCGSAGGKFRENSGKITGKIYPESRNALNSRILGTGKGKPAGNIGSTLPWTLCRPSVRDVFRNRQLQPSRVFLNKKAPDGRWRKFPNVLETAFYSGVGRFWRAAAVCSGFGGLGSP